MEIKLSKIIAKPGYFFPCDVSVLEVAEQIHLAEDTALVEEQLVVADLLVVVVFDVAFSQLTSTRRQQTPRLYTHSHSTVISA